MRRVSEDWKVSCMRLYCTISTSHEEKILKLSHFLEQVEHGIFAIRSPHRPNHIGLSVVKIEKIEANKLYFSEVDVLDQTPLLDIKPYVKYFNSRKNVKCDWLDKHFKNGNIPE